MTIRTAHETPRELPFGLRGDEEWLDLPGSSYRLPTEPAASAGAGDFGKSHAYGVIRSGDRLGATEVFELVRTNQGVYSVATMCRVLDVFSSGYYAWQGRGPCVRARRDEALRAKIEAIYTRSCGSYGVLRVHAELKEQGVSVGRKRVARLMRKAGLDGGEPA